MHALTTPFSHSANPALVWRISDGPRGLSARSALKPPGARRVLLPWCGPEGIRERLLEDLEVRDGLVKADDAFVEQPPDGRQPVFREILRGKVQGERDAFDGRHARTSHAAFDLPDRPLRRRNIGARSNLKRERLLAPSALDAQTANDRSKRLGAVLSLSLQVANRIGAVRLSQATVTSEVATTDTKIPRLPRSSRERAQTDHPKRIAATSATRTA